MIGQDNPTAFEREARALGVADRFVISPGREDIPELLQGADMMVHPAVMESGGLVIIESIIAGLPVITTEVCGHAHYVREARSGVVLQEPFDQSALNSALCCALQDAQQRATWSHNGVRFGRETPELYDMPARVLQEIKMAIAGRDRESA